MRTLAAVVVLVLAGIAPAQNPAVKLPQGLKGETMLALIVPAEATGGGEKIKWYLPDPGLSFSVPPQFLNTDRIAPVIAKRAGRYRVVAYTADKDGNLSDPAVSVVEFFDDNPPGPGPGPTPPPPVDTFRKTLASAYALESAADKEALPKLKSLYRVYASELSKPDGLSSVKTLGDLLTSMRGVAVTTGLAGKLPKTQAVIAQRIVAELGSDLSAPFDRATVSGLFQTILNSLPE